MRVRGWATGATAVFLLISQASAHSQQSARRKPAPIERVVRLSALTPRERLEQMLDRFTYGPRPGEIDRVLALGADRWFQQQLDPNSLGDAVFAKRVAELPTIAMSPAQALTVFPDRSQVAAVAQGKVPMPTDPLQRTVMEVQVAKWNAELDRKKIDGTKEPITEPADAEKAAQKKADQLAAAHLAGGLLVLPRDQRMAAIAAMPVADRITLTTNGNLPGPVHHLLVAEFTPREREALIAMAAQVSSTGNLANELAQAHMLRDILSERQLQAVMTDFWFNHFNVFIGKDADQWYTATYERDTIRPHALGKFRDLLFATATSPAMMVYLDNAQSVGPDSMANGFNPANPKSKRGNRGLNENYGREVMELHTIGVNGGYTQGDVTALSAILTGWGVDHPQDGGPFLFDPKRHEPGAKAWFGYCIGEDGTVTKLPLRTSEVTRSCGAENTPATPASMQQGMASLNLLAASPQTARFISSLLAQYFVADDPPSSLVETLTRTYLATDGDIGALLGAIVSSPEFNDRRYFHNKVKTPVEFLASAYRATATDPQNLSALVNEARTMGMPLYSALPPTGYLLTANEWMNSTALIDRLNFAWQLTGGKLSNQSFDAPRLLADGLMTPGISIENLPATNANARHDPGQVPRTSLHGVGPSADTGKAPWETSAGAQLAANLLEKTVTGGPVSPRTHALIAAQVAQQPASATATDTLNLITGLLLGSPEFQSR